jgi:hypothetical protein
MVGGNTHASDDLSHIELNKCTLKLSEGRALTWWRCGLGLIPGVPKLEWNKYRALVKKKFNNNSSMPSEIWWLSSQRVRQFSNKQGLLTDQPAQRGAGYKQNA